MNRKTRERNPMWNESGADSLAEEIAHDPRTVGRHLQGAPARLSRLDLAVPVRVAAFVHAQELKAVVLCV
jgi:hypothetical protein